MEALQTGLVTGVTNATLDPVSFGRLSIPPSCTSESEKMSSQILSYQLQYILNLFKLVICPTQMQDDKTRKDISL